MAVNDTKMRHRIEILCEMLEVLIEEGPIAPTALLRKAGVATGSHAQLMSILDKNELVAISDRYSKRGNRSIRRGELKNVWKLVNITLDGRKAYRDMRILLNKFR